MDKKTENKMILVVEKICSSSLFGLEEYYNYIRKHGREFMEEVFNYIKDSSKNVGAVVNKYFDIYFDIELNNMEIDEDTYLELCNKYGEVKVNRYFEKLLELFPDSKKIRRKYEQIYFYIDNMREVENAYDFDCDSYLSEDSFKMYLKEISGYKLLEVSEEKELLRRLYDLNKMITIAFFDDRDDMMAFGDIERVLKNIKTKDQLKKLKKILDKMSNNDKIVVNQYIANNKINVDNECDNNSKYIEQQLDYINERYMVRDKIINANLRLVISIAKHYSGKNLEMLDLVSEGNIGLMRAVKKFDIKKNARLSTYATWWIRQVIIRMLSDSSRLIRIPVHMSEKIYKYNGAIRTLTQENGYVPSDEEVSIYLGISVNEIIEIKNIIQSTNILSLDAAVCGDDDSDSFYVDFIASDDPTLFDTYVDQERREILLKAMETLSEKEADVLKKRFGFNDGHTYTLEEVGKIHGVTRERIRQIEKKALRRLRNKKFLLDYVD